MYYDGIESLQHQITAPDGLYGRFWNLTMGLIKKQRFSEIESLLRVADQHRSYAAERFSVSLEPFASNGLSSFEYAAPQLPFENSRFWQRVFAAAPLCSAAVYRAYAYWLDEGKTKVWEEFETTDREEAAALLRGSDNMLKRRREILRGLLPEHEEIPHHLTKKILFQQVREMEENMGHPPLGDDEYRKWFNRRLSERLIEDNSLENYKRWAWGNLKVSGRT